MAQTNRAKKGPLAQFFALVSLSLSPLSRTQQRSEQKSLELKRKTLQIIRQHFLLVKAQLELSPTGLPIV